MDQYKINREDLEELVKKVYEEACYGYLDLKEATCEKMISEFLADKSKHETQLQQNAFTQATGRPMTVWDTSTTAWNASGLYVSMSSAPASNEHLVLAGLRPASEAGIRIQSSTGNVVLSDEFELRPETQLRSDNFVGNESERN